ncbi:MAG: 50S ribosomal protein L20 [Proteobacteria bacterium]|nr:MAG: 50S ribosomal protein L20 [Pseudomonadota bacterium]
MPRAKRGTKARARRKKVFKETEGFFIGRNNKYRRAVETLHRAWVYAFRDRRAKKRDFRGLWITRLSAAAENNGTSYSKLIHALKLAKITLDRKVLSDIAINDPVAFTAVVKAANAAHPAQ